MTSTFQIYKQDDNRTLRSYFKIIPTYSGEVNPNLNIVNFKSIRAAQSTLNPGIPEIYTWVNNINFLDTLSSDRAEDDIFQDARMANLPANLETLKFRLVSMKISRGKLYNRNNARIAEAELLAQNADYTPSTIGIKFNNNWMFTSSGADLVNGTFDPTDLGRLPTFRRFDIRNEPSDYIKFPVGSLNLSWGVDIYLFHNYTTTVNNPTLISAFLQQRLSAIEFTLEFVYTVQDIPKLITEEETEAITMPNLYKMVSSFMKQRKEISSLKGKRDGIDDELLKEFQSAKRNKSKLVSITDELTDEEFKNAIGRILKLL